MIRITYVGHACVLIEVAGTRILTDPVLRPRIGHVRRVASPPEAAALEGIDLVLLSHAHHDHLDVPSLRSIQGSPRALCPTPAAAALRSAGMRPQVVSAGQAVELEGALVVEATPAEHDGRRWPPLGDGEALGFVVRDCGDAGRSIYFAGDTGAFAAMKEIGPVDLALLPVAGWGPRLGPGHLDPEEAAEAAVAVGARVAIPIHWGTYERLGMRSGTDRSDPARRFAAAAQAREQGIRVEVLAPGTSLEL